MEVGRTSTGLKQKIEEHSKKRTQKELAAGFDHFIRVYRTAKSLASGFDDQALHAACFLHDIILDEVHEKSSYNYAENFLKRIDFPEEKLKIVRDAILNHVPEGRPKTIEGVLLHDADLLDFLGATGIARTSIGAREWHGATTLKDVLETMKRFRKITFKNLILEKSKEIAEEKIQAMDAVIIKLEKEIVIV